MYRTEDASARNPTFFDFNQGCGVGLDPKDEWVVLADSVDWAAIESLYAELFPSGTGRPAKPLRMALGALLVQKRTGLADRALVAEVARNPYLQYFLGMPGYEHSCPFSATSLVTFRKRLSAGFLEKVNELLLERAGATPEHRGRDGGPDPEAPSTCVLDATCSPVDIRFPQDFSLLNEARVKLEGMIDALWEMSGKNGKKPRDYRRVARKEYLAMAKAKRRPHKKMRAHLRRELGRVGRDLRIVGDFLESGLELPARDAAMLETIRELFRQQEYMFDNRVSRVDDRIVSLAQPWVRPIKRGKAKAPTEFGPKWEVSVDELGHARLEERSFDAYNESGTLRDAVERYRERTGSYPDRVLADQIYRTRDNLRFCKDHGIELSGPKLGRPPKGAAPGRPTKAEREAEADRIEVERFFSRAKRCFGAGTITCRLEETQMASVALSVIAANLFAMPASELFSSLSSALGGDFLLLVLSEAA